MDFYINCISFAYSMCDNPEMSKNDESLKLTKFFVSYYFVPDA